MTANTLLFCFLAFVMGSFPTAYMAVKRLKGVDIRSIGSGNVGATNAARILGKKKGLLIFAIDFVKGALPVWVFAISTNHRFPEGMLIVGGCAILGHIFTPFLGFKGGKGVATGAGVVLAAYPFCFLLSLISWLVSFKICRIVSLSSLIAVVVLALSGIFFVNERISTAIFMMMAVVVFLTHRSNVSRLFNREEPRS